MNTSALQDSVEQKSGQTLLLLTIHGSHLYGLANETSDVDYFAIISGNPTNRKKYARQTIDDIDLNVVDLGTFLNGVNNGVPQYCEALMSRVPVVDKISELRSDYVLTPAIAERYLRTIKSFALDDTFKSKRHATRLALNLRSALAYGRFNPTLNDLEVAMCNTLANLESEYLSEFLRDYALQL